MPDLQSADATNITDIPATDRESKFKGRPIVEPDLRQTLGETYRMLGEYASAEPHLERAYKIRK